MEERPLAPQAASAGIALRRFRGLVESAVMAVLEEYRFEIPAFTPETMPLDRLLEYLGQISILLGDPSELHLIGIETASTQPVLAMPRAVALKARAKAEEVQSGGGSERRRNAYTRIQRMVEDDGGGAAVLKAPEGAIILRFEPRAVVLPEAHSIRQPTTIQGTLISVGGKQERSNLLIQDEAGDIVSGCSANRALAKQLAQYLYETIRLSGDGTWERSAEGVWRLERMTVQAYLPLDDRPLGDVIKELQSIPVDWPSDTLQRLRDLRSTH